MWYFNEANVSFYSYCDANIITMPVPLQKISEDDCQILNNWKFDKILKKDKILSPLCDDISRSHHFYAQRLSTFVSL